MTASERSEFLRKPFILPADVLVFSVNELARHIREELGCSEDDFAVTRPGMRSFSRIVDQETAKLLEEFRQPTPLAQAVLNYSLRDGHDPQKVLVEAFPMLVSFSEAAFLVPADSPLAEGVSASFAVGQLVDHYEVRRLIQVLEDTELYLAQGPDGTAVALKIARPEPSEFIKQTFEREVAILEHLSGRCCPRLITYRTFRDRPFIASSWLSGISVSKRAQELRTAANSTWRQQLHQLCFRVIEVYSTLHAAGIIHGDTHPRNLLVDADDSVSIIDFGLSRWMGRDDLDHAFRSGLAWFVEPEMAEPILSGQAAPPISFAGEQYAVAALIYFLLCGEHYLTARAEREALYRQIVEEAPPPFTRLGFETWPEVEAVLAHALSKCPQDRYRSMAEFGEAFLRARPPEPDRQWVGFTLPTWRMKCVEDILNKTAYDPRLYDELFPSPPTASIYFGATGLVWFLYRAAQVREEAELLAAADLWSRQIFRRSEDPGSFESLDQEAQREAKNSPASLFLKRPGVDLVHALVSHSRGDLSSAARSTQSFIDSAKVTEEAVEMDFIFGRSGILVGGLVLLEAIGWSSRLETSPLRDFLLGEANLVRGYLQKQPMIGDKRSLPHLGVAHGWAGMLYAQLMACKTLQVRPSEEIYDQLQQLARQAEPDGRGVSWLGTVQHPGQESETPAHASGWCSGSAGHVHLWILASEIFRHVRFLELAEKAAWYVWEHADTFPNLCCGLTGRAFALLRYYRNSGERAWLVRAQQLAWRAFETYANKLAWDSRTLSLYRGALGPALLAIELENPERAVMPVFEPEGWPSSIVHEKEYLEVLRL